MVHSLNQVCMKSHYIGSPITNPSANVVNSHPVTDSSTQLLCSGQHHHHFASVTYVAASQCCLSLPSPLWAIGAERLEKLKPHRCATASAARYNVQRGDSICLLSPLEKHWSRWNWAGVQTLEELISKTTHYPFYRFWRCNYLMSINSVFLKCLCGRMLLS